MTQPNQPDSVEEIVETFLKHPAMQRLNNIELTAIATGRVGEYKGETLVDALRTLITQAKAEARQAGIDEAVEIITNISEFNAKLAIEPSRDFLEGAVAMKTFILSNIQKNER